MNNIQQKIFDQREKKTYDEDIQHGKIWQHHIHKGRFLPATSGRWHTDCMYETT